MSNWNLNTQQRQAVDTINGRILVLAGAGSGKTRVITYRTANLIKNGIDPKSILGLTFTNKAAQEMRSRLKNLIPAEEAKKVTLSTFHSFCLSILRKEAAKLGYGANFTIYDEKDVERLIKNLLKETFLISTKQLPAIGPIISVFSDAKNKNNYSFAHLNKNEGKLIKELFERFNAALRTYNAVDFDSLLTLTFELFEKHPDILAKYQDKYKYIMIDEYQDTSPTQYQIAEKLAEKNNNLCVVGDDDQSIYAFRGAEISHILKFKADHVIKLEQNYRSSPIILEAADSVIKNNQGRHLKKVWSEKENKSKLILFHAPTDKDEAEAIAQKAIALKQAYHLNLKDIAVLYRSNALSRQLEMALMSAPWQDKGSWRRGIPYEIFGGTEFAERSEIKDVIAYLRVIVNPQDLEALLRIINVPRRGISDKTLETLANYAKEKNLSLYQTLEMVARQEKNQEEPSIILQNKTLKGCISFLDAIEEAKTRFTSGQPLFETLKWFLEKINYRQAIKEETKSEKAEIFKWENAEEVINALAQYEETEPNPTLTDFISTTALSKQNIFRNEQKSSFDKLQLMTFHSAKGLEFKACFLIGLEDHILPHEKSQTKTGIEEERRLFYVAMTRAMEHLYLSMAQNRRKGGGLIATSPSRFLKEIPKELLEITSYK